MNTSSPPTPPGSGSPHTSTASGLAALAALRIQRTHPAAWLGPSLGVIAPDQATRCLPNAKHRSLYRDLQARHDELSGALRPWFG